MTSSINVSRCISNRYLHTYFKNIYVRINLNIFVTFTDGDKINNTC